MEVMTEPNKKLAVIFVLSENNKNNLKLRTNYITYNNELTILYDKQRKNIWPKSNI